MHDTPLSPLIIIVTSTILREVNERLSLRSRSSFDRILRYCELREADENGRLPTEKNKA